MKSEYRILKIGIHDLEIGAHSNGHEHHQAVVQAAEMAKSPAGPLGGHVIHAVIFGAGLLIFFGLAFRLYYLEYRRTGRWQPPR